MIEFKCKSCGSRFKVEDTRSGRRIRCPKCGSISVVPDNRDKINFQCSNCGRGFSVHRVHVGKKGKCPECKNAIVVPTDTISPPESTGKVSFTCSMCDEVVQMPATSVGKMIECPACGCYMEVSSGDAQGPSVSSDHEDINEEGAKECAESEGVNKHVIFGIWALAAVVVAGLIISAAIFWPSGSRPTRRAENLRTQRRGAANALDDVEDSRAQRARRKRELGLRAARVGSFVTELLLLCFVILLSFLIWWLLKGRPSLVEINIRPMMTYLVVVGAASCAAMAVEYSVSSSSQKGLEQLMVRIVIWPAWLLHSIAGSAFGAWPSILFGCLVYFGILFRPLFKASFVSNIADQGRYVGMQLLFFILHFVIPIVVLVLVFIGLLLAIKGSRH